ncbi:trypsin Inhibitor like cysteine rich domain protein [Ancylostoma ceylanicum]|uniref:Trypsin Inhibitor like cysteine rich domain protein n=1 Tax=Ancylostoma ceylanicum TaxID=53326 RepID=A0A0D6LV43_9BILA|nr:trypsin Inhibitor like cysteine rich domain protein [Ancylostoma ceylanicum]
MAKVLTVFCIAVVIFLFQENSVMASDCPVNEQYHRCGPRCGPSCARPEPLRCENKCVKNACQCEPGYIREYVGGMCIPMEECNVRRKKPSENPTGTSFKGIAW